MKLSDLIYEAALDDQLFAELPRLIVNSLGARSCVLHWRDEAGAAEIFGHSGYFSDAQMADYASNFVEHDIWTEAGMRRGYVNRAWRTSDLVPVRIYQDSIFYNEWIRPMGDDTFYCCGSVMQTASGDGCVGLHRGKGQDDFSQEILNQLNGLVGHLRGMFAVRGRFAQLAARDDMLTSIFAASDSATLAVDANGYVLLSNEAADSLLRSGRFLSTRRGQLRAASESSRKDLDAALHAATDGTNGSSSSCLLQADDGAFVISTLTPLRTSRRSPAALLTVAEQRPRNDSDILSGHLQKAFGLTPSEADVAMRLAGGAAVREIADSRRSALATVRTQVKSLLSKMNARKQSDVVRVIGKLNGGLPTANA